MIRKGMRPGLAVSLLVLSSLSVAAAPEPGATAVEHARFVDALRLDGELFHVQGLEVTGARIWVTSVDRIGRKGYLHEFDRATGRLLRRLEVTDGARYHPGGISISATSIWIPVAEMKPHSSAVLLEIEAATLKVRRRIRVADHLGCVAVSGDDLVAANWDSELFYVFDLAGNGPARTVPNPSGTRYQDLKFAGDQLVGGGHLTWWSGAIDWIDFPTMRLRKSLQAGAIGPVRPFGRGGPYTGEGMAIDGRDLYVVPEDGPSRMFHFRLDA